MNQKQQDKLDEKQVEIIRHCTESMYNLSEISDALWSAGFGTNGRKYTKGEISKMTTHVLGYFYRS